MCVMLIISPCRGAKLVASLSSVLEAMSGVLVLWVFLVVLFVSVYCFCGLSSPLCSFLQKRQPRNY